jgi:hypothetical protein
MFIWKYKIPQNVAFECATNHQKSNCSLKNRMNFWIGLVSEKFIENYVKSHKHKTWLKINICTLNTDALFVDWAY